ncbi:MAG: Na+:solute symporter [Gemmatimonadetes bacterium]|nr:Na+:solute symporter [Gemmatimonadota bacterium]
MTLTSLDWIIVLVSIVVSFLPAVILAKRAGSSTAEFFTSGRSAPWWLVGVSMVATTFSTDTPNLVTNLVREKGVANNWAWWSFLLTGMMTVFFYARLWRRSNVLTDLEFYEIRYSGKASTFVRGFRAVYLGLFFNCVIMASVNLAAAKIANVMLGWPMWQTLLICAVLNVAFAATSGLWGVLVTDFIQFGIAMAGAFAAAYYSLQQPEVGGLVGLFAKLPPQTLHLLPDFSDWGLTLSVLIIPLTVQWWAVWYPGAEPGGGSYIAQRMLASKSENDALAGTLFFNFAHYAIRPWPWIITGLCSILVFPELSDIARTFPYVDPKLIGHDMAYPAMLKFLPAGFMGLMIAGMLAAYVSTISTHLNWGTSYLVHDVYRRFVKEGASEAHYVMVGRLVTALLMVLAAGLTFVLDSARQSFELLMSIDSFYALVRPAGPGWKVVRDRTGLPASADSLPMAMLGWVLGCAFVYAALFGAGSFLYGNTAQALVWLGVFVVSTVGLARILPRIWRSSES